MEQNETVKLYRNIFEEGTAKGSFFITKTGLMAPRTRNVNLWGLASSEAIPPKYMENPNVVTASRQGLDEAGVAQLPAFFKFQKNPISCFTEAVSMQIATHFNTRTSYNYPATIDQSPGTLYYFTQNQLPEPKSNFGTLVYSFLKPDEELVSFYKMIKSQDITTDFQTISSHIPKFLESYMPALTRSEISNFSNQINRDYAYQYLLRDYMGDIDYTSRNAGLVINKTAGYATLAPSFDYGEAMNLLTEAKFEAPQLDSLENYPENTRQFMSQVIDKINARKLEKFNASPQELAQQTTFEGKSDLNIRYICSRYPDVAEAFRQDLQNFLSANVLPEIMGQYAGENGIVTPDQAKMCVEYLEARGAIFEEKLTGHLQKEAPDYASLREQKSADLYKPTVIEAPLAEFEEEFFEEDYSELEPTSEQVKFLGNNLANLEGTQGEISGQTYLNSDLLTDDILRDTAYESVNNIKTQIVPGNNLSTQNNLTTQDPDLEP